MKTQHITYILIFLMIIFSSCHEITVSTKVNKDGSFTRTIIISGDSAEVFDVNLPYPIDSTWTSSQEPDTTEAGKIILTYSKNYKKGEELNTEIKNDTSWNKNLNRTIEIDKRYGLFYSYITFKETYPAANPFTRLDYKKYLTEADIACLHENFVPLNKQDSIRVDEAEDKMDEFLLETTSYEIMEVLKEGMVKLNIPELDTSKVIFYEDSIKNKLEDWSFNDPIEFIGFYKEWTEEPLVDELYKLEPPLFGVQHKKLLSIIKLIEMEQYTQEVEMPGLITYTNSSKINGNRVSWHVAMESYFFQDFEMTVESRVINKWGFILTGIVILMTILILIIKSRKSSKE